MVMVRGLAEFVRGSAYTDLSERTRLQLRIRVEPNVELARAAGLEVNDGIDVGYEAVGEIDARLEMVEEWRIPDVEGTVTYLRDGRVRGALYWNLFGSIGSGRRAIGSVLNH